MGAKPKPRRTYQPQDTVHVSIRLPVALVDRALHYYPGGSLSDAVRRLMSDGATNRTLTRKLERAIEGLYATDSRQRMKLARELTR